LLPASPRCCEYTQLLEDARHQAVDRLVENATLMGANAIIMMRCDSAEIGQTMIEIVACGTAVVLELVNTRCCARRCSGTPRC
jgi:uncharacterized protein YbjQ (UPF0145 family)